MKKTLTLILTLVLVTITWADAPFKPCMEPLRLNHKNNGVYDLANVRCGFDGSADRPVHKAMRVKTYDVDEVYYLSEQFGDIPQAQHGMLFFKMKDRRSSVQMPTIYRKFAYGIILSVEARTRVGENYNPLHGMQGRYPLLYMITTYTDRLQQTLNNGSTLKHFRLNLTQAQKTQLLVNSLERALKYDPSHLYNTLTNNCVSNAVYMLNTVLPANKKIPMTVDNFPNPNAMLPNLVYDNFVKTGLAKPMSLLVNPGDTVRDTMSDGTSYVFNPAEHKFSDRALRLSRAISANTQQQDNGFQDNMMYYAQVADDSMDDTDALSLYDQSGIQESVTEYIVENPENLTEENLEWLEESGLSEKDYMQEINRVIQECVANQ